MRNPSKLFEVFIMRFVIRNYFLFICCFVLLRFGLCFVVRAIDLVNPVITALSLLSGLYFMMALVPPSQEYCMVKVSLYLHLF